MDKSCGMITIAYSIPEKVMTAQEIALASGFNCDYIIDKLGFKQKRVATDVEKPSDFAIKAAKEAINKAAISPDKIDFIIYCSNGIYDYQFWSPSAFVQKSINAKKAVTFELNNGCNSSMGLFVAKNLLAMQSNWQYGLVIVSDTLSKFVNYADQASFPLFSFSDGAAAVLLAANHNKNILLGQGLYTDGDYVNCSRIEFSVAGPSLSSANSHENRYIKMEDEKKVNSLRETVMADNYIRVMKDAMAQANITQDMLSFVLTNQNSRSIVERVLNLISISPDKHHKTSQYFGHIGGVDVFYGLNDLLEKKYVSKNDLVLMATTGIGFHWGAHIVKI